MPISDHTFGERVRKKIMLTINEGNPFLHPLNDDRFGGRASPAGFRLTIDGENPFRHPLPGNDWDTRDVTSSPLPSKPNAQDLHWAPFLDPSPSAQNLAVLIPHENVNDDCSLPNHAGEEEEEVNMSSKIGLQQMPEEVQQRVLDHLLGQLSSISSTSKDGSGTRNWSNVLRHPRSKNGANLALVSQSWRRMVQERLYRHIKIEATVSGLAECSLWFLTHPWLRDYVRHIEFWTPVWERRAGTGIPHHTELSGTSGAITFEGVPEELSRRQGAPPPRHLVNNNINSAYKLCTDTSTLNEIFWCVKNLFSQACIMTLEGGHCKNPPAIKLLRNSDSRMPTLEQIQTLVIKGAFIIMREESQFKAMAGALPNLKEWHCSYVKPKAAAYGTVTNIIREFPKTITHLNLNLESFYHKEVPKIHTIQLSHHLCHELGSILPQLEAITFTGRICSAFGDFALRAVEGIREPKLKAVDIVVKNCCREPTAGTHGAGIHHPSFIRAFENLVVSMVRLLPKYKELNYIRVRFIDLDGAWTLLNPYFQLKGDTCKGLWSDLILSTLQTVRPDAKYDVPHGDVTETLSERGVDKTFLMYPTTRPTTMKVTSYEMFAGGIYA